MKKYIVLSLVLLLAGTAFAGNKPRKSSRQEMGINGNAVYVIEYTYDIHGGRNGGRRLICSGIRIISTFTATHWAGTSITAPRS